MSCKMTDSPTAALTRSIEMRGPPLAPERHAPAEPASVIPTLPSGRPPVPSGLLLGALPLLLMPLLARAQLESTRSLGHTRGRRKVLFRALVDVGPLLSIITYSTSRYTRRQQLNTCTRAQQGSSDTISTRY